MRPTPTDSTLTLAAHGLPHWSTFFDNGDGTGTLSGTPVDAGSTFTITLTATDPGNLTARQAFTLIVVRGDPVPLPEAPRESPSVEARPTLAPIPGLEGAEHTRLAVMAKVENAAAVGLGFALAGAVPAGASIDSVTGLFSWTPSETQGPGIYAIAIQLIDRSTGAVLDEQVLRVSVTEVGAAPVLRVPAVQPADPGGRSVFVIGASVTTILPPSCASLS